MDEVIKHLMQLNGAQVEIKLLIDTTLPNGTPVPIVRTVTENCRTLHVAIALLLHRWETQQKAPATF